MDQATTSNAGPRKPSSFAGSVRSKVGQWLMDDLARRGAPAALAENYFAGLLDAFGLRYECAESDQARVPREGPVLIVANHPFGLAEGPILGDLLTRQRRDVKFLANSLLTAIPDLAPHVIPVDPLGGSEAATANLRGLRESLQWLKDGHVLVAFPAGEVASFQYPQLAITDPSWHTHLARLVRKSSATVVPVFFHGTNSPAFHAAGVLHPRLRTLLLPFELQNRRGNPIQVAIGSPIPARRLTQMESDEQLIAYLRQRTYLQRHRKASVRLQRPGKSLSRVAPAVDPSRQALEVSQLPPDQLLASSNEFNVFVAVADQIPNILREIGRLREITFRAVGEGTGNSLDLDAFDQHYQHLFMWNRENNEVVGAYRMAPTDAVVSRFGREGLYTSTLFRLKPGFLEAIEPALELGRSFVRQEYQRSFTPLLLLWKAIGSYVVLNPRYKVLFGPVSISREYCTHSQELMVAFAKSRRKNPHLAGAVEPRRSLSRWSRTDKEAQALGQMLPDVAELSMVVSELEPDGKGVPVLLQHYLNIGGEVLAFSVDGSFSDVLDGLVVVDLTQSSRRMLDRYMGKEGADRFLSAHALETSVR